MASQTRSMLLLPLLAAAALILSAPSALSPAFVGCQRLAASRPAAKGGLASRGSVRLAAKGAGNDIYFDPNADLDFEDEDLDDYDSAQAGYDSYDDMGEYTEPSEEVLDEWARDPLANQVLEGFQGEKEEGSQRLSFRSTYRLLEALGLDKMEFIAGFGGGDYDDEDFEDENFDGEVASDSGQGQRSGYQTQRR